MSAERHLRFWQRLGGALAVLVVSAVMAQNPALQVQDAWTRQVPGSDVAAVYLTLRNLTAQPVTVTAVESPLASHVMIHETKTESGLSKMRPHEGLVIPARQTVKLEPGGLHVMLHGLSQPLSVGQNVALSLVLADGSKVPVTARVRPLDAQ